MIRITLAFGTSSSFKPPWIQVVKSFCHGSEFSSSKTSSKNGPVITLDCLIVLSSVTSVYRVSCGLRKAVALLRAEEENTCLSDEKKQTEQQEHPGPEAQGLPNKTWRHGRKMQKVGCHTLASRS